ncbi:MAG TPA: hypothetical protein VMD99_17780 [Terriglobales bacterium]|nr:hypothetical protein [Terriglobales bacterium]
MATFAAAPNESASETMADATEIEITPVESVPAETSPRETSARETGPGETIVAETAAIEALPGTTPTIETATEATADAAYPSATSTSEMTSAEEQTCELLIETPVEAPRVDAEPAEVATGETSIVHSSMADPATITGAASGALTDATAIETAAIPATASERTTAETASEMTPTETIPADTTAAESSATETIVAETTPAESTPAETTRGGSKKADRPFRVKLRGSVLVLVRLPNKRDVRAAFHQLSVTGGVVHLEKPLDEKLGVEMIFHIGGATIREKAQMLFPMWATQGWMQPFRFMDMTDASRASLDSHLKAFLGESAKGAAAGA